MKSILNFYGIKQFLPCDKKIYKMKIHMSPYVFTNHYNNNCGLVPL